MYPLNKQSFNEKNKLISKYFNGGKIPPQSNDLEVAILGAILNDQKAMPEVADKLAFEMFYSESHQLIYKAMVSLFGNSKPIDMMTVTEELKTAGSLDRVGGIPKVVELTHSISSASNIEYHSLLITQMYIKRELINYAHSLLNDAYSDEEDVFDIISRLDLKKDDLLNSVITKKDVSNDELFVITLKHLEQISKNKDKITGVPSGFVDLDKITGGWQKTDLIIVAARPAMGKTSIVLQAAINACKDYNKVVAFFSLEMSMQQLMNRQMSIVAEVELEKFRKNSLTDADWKVIHEKSDIIANSKIIWDDTPSLSITEFKAKAKKLKRKNNIDLIIIDYLQLMTVSSRSKNSNREQDIAHISRSLKAIAKELEIPIIALAQLSRNLESRPGNSKKPMLSDLRESGSIEQDADMVIFLYRPEYYNVSEYENGFSTAGCAEVIVAKHRNGATDEILLRFIGKYTSFQNMNPETI